MIPEIVQVADGLPTAVLAADELLIVLAPPGATRAPWVTELIAKAVPSLSKAAFYLKYHVGFLRPGSETPYVVLDWQKPGASALERRWVANKAGLALGTLFNLKKIACYLEAGCGMPELAIVEDILTRHTRPRYERSTLSHLRILSPAVPALRACDPHYAVRLKNQLGFRQWVNENPDEMTSLAIGSRLASFCKAHDCTFEALGTEKLAELQMNLLLAVGQASDLSPSRLFICTHGLRPGVKPLMLVGKGITFDTGGINLKSHESHVNAMKNDMGGAGLMAHLFMALVESGKAGPLALVIPACENLIDGRAMKPGAVIRSYSGKDVIIEHTDAEGRLILADALSYAQKQLDPALTLVAATLTTASLRQFSPFFTAVHFAPEDLQAQLAAAAAATGEGFSFWGEFLPFLQGNRSPAADLTNMGRLPSHASIGGGSNVAAHFLKEFAVNPMVHFDIFATTWNWGGDYPGAHYGATGAPFNALFRCLSAYP